MNPNDSPNNAPHAAGGRTPSRSGRQAGLPDRKIVSILRAAGKRGHYFTINNLYAIYFRNVRNRSRLAHFIPSILLIPALLLVLVPFYLARPVSWSPALGLLVPALLIYLILKRKPALEFSEFSELIRHWSDRHHEEKLIDRPRLDNRSVRLRLYPKELKKTKFILVVETPTVADLLILNSFPTKHQALVMTAAGYPRAATERLSGLLFDCPKLQVYYLHDAVLEDRPDLVPQQVQALVPGREVIDLGLTWEDVDARSALRVLPVEFWGGRLPADAIGYSGLMQMLTEAVALRLPFRQARSGRSGSSALTLEDTTTDLGDTNVGLDD